MKLTKTSRGFDLIEFKESGGAKCSLQKSSSAEEDYVWLGADDLGLKGFAPYRSWQDISEDEIKRVFGFTEIVTDTRMHLSREQVKALLPYLKKFVETGELT
jgi:hypothetical protein